MVVIIIIIIIIIIVVVVVIVIIIIIIIIVYPMHWIDPQISFFRRSVCVSVNRSVVERSVNRHTDTSTNFFTDFHEILHTAQKCGHFVAYCL